MFSALLGKTFKTWGDNWIERRHNTQPGAVFIHRRRTYILPSGSGYAFGVMLFIMLMWAINYSNSLGFVLTFLLAGVVLNSMWRGNQNLLQLRLQPEQAEPVFVGQTAYFIFTFDNPDPQPRYGIGLQWRRTSTVVYTDIPAQGSATLSLPLASTQRGVLRPGRLKVVTRFPLGLFQAWSWIRFDIHCLVYPAPEGELPLPISTASALQSGTSADLGPGSDDYAGLRVYVPGDSSRRVAWKASSKSKDLLVKRFADTAMPELWLNWYALTPLDTEARLSQLCRWVLEADKRGGDYGLRLPDFVIDPDRGKTHRDDCLRALALFGHENTQDQA